MRSRLRRHVPGDGRNAGAVTNELVTAFAPPRTTPWLHQSIIHPSNLGSITSDEVIQALHA
jgi:hypothetical protein